MMKIVIAQLTARSPGRRIAVDGEMKESYNLHGESFRSFGGHVMITHVMHRPTARYTLWFVSTDDRQMAYVRACVRERP